MKTLTSITGTENKLANFFLLSVILFIAFTLGAFVVTAFGDTNLINSASF